ncbi:MAG TPA: hypothetical protein GXX19_11870 [Syntrophomonadaceae bacterium]|nr:hypothetical protein [Syntrophomonadaceae bacterium]
MANQKSYQANEFGWRTLLGSVSFAPVSALAPGSEPGPADTERYFARFSPPMSAISQSIITGIEAGKKYEVGFNVASNSPTGFFSATVTFLNDRGTILGTPYSTGVKLSNLQPSEFAPISFVAGPAPKGAAKADVTLIAVGASPEKVIDINGIYFKEAAEG